MVAERKTKRGSNEKNDEEMTLMRDALDTLALTLTDHDYCWTDRERQLYEQAIALTWVFDCRGVDLAAAALCLPLPPSPAQRQASALSYIIVRAD